MNWQPIETAPKDLAVIIWDKAQEQCVIAINKNDYWMVADSYGFNEDGEIYKDDISHWMPCPKAPQ